MTQCSMTKPATDSPQAIPQNALFTLATFNVRCGWDKVEPLCWETRIPLICEVLRRTGVDIAGLQEPRDCQLQALLKASDYKSIGVAREDFKQQGEYSCILYNPERFDVLDSGTFGLSEKPDVPGYKSWDTACPRIATWGIFHDRLTDKAFIMYNTHLDHVSKLAQANGIKLIAEHASQKKQLGLPMILTGDFNVTPDAEPYKIAHDMLLDSKEVSETGHQGETGTFHGWGQRTDRPLIDYVFVSPDFRVLKHWTEDGRVKGLYSSDHDPVIVKLALK